MSNREIQLVRLSTLLATCSLLLRRVHGAVIHSKARWKARTSVASAGNITWSVSPIHASSLLLGRLT